MINIEADEVARCHQANARRGDTVLVRMDDGTEKEFEVKYEPWRLGHGAWVIGLKGIAGGYSLDRVLRIVRFAEYETPS